MRFYYILWSDAINWTRSSVRTIGVWRIHTLGFITLAMAFNLAILILIVESIFDKRIPISDISKSITSSESINRFLVGFLVFYLPPLVINYFLVFFNKKWERIRKKYAHKNGLIYKWYMFFSIVLPYLIILGYSLLSKIFK